MLAFLVRRVIGMVLVLVAVSFIVFLIFVVIPGGDPAQRIAGRTATQQNIENIKHKLALDKPFYTQYWRLMKASFDNSLISYTNQQASGVSTSTPSARHDSSSSAALVYLSRPASSPGSSRPRISLTTL